MACAAQLGRLPSITISKAAVKLRRFLWPGGAQLMLGVDAQALPW
jgi:hypothetical protein